MYSMNDSTVNHRKKNINLNLLIDISIRVYATIGVYISVVIGSNKISLRTLDATAILIKIFYF